MQIHALKQDSSMSIKGGVLFYNDGPTSAVLNSNFFRPLFQAATAPFDLKYFNHTIQYNKEKPEVRKTKIFDLSSDLYKLKRPIELRLEIFSDETLSIIPELELYGEGDTETDSLEDIKAELIDLYEYIKKVPTEKLGRDPKAWKNIIDTIIFDNGD